MHRFSGQLTGQTSNIYDFQGNFKESSQQYDLMKKLVKDFKQNEIIDFDDHFLDAKSDWRNIFIEEYIS